jgi:hypothetical protein
VLEKYSRKAVAGIGLAMLVIASLQLSNNSAPAYSEDLDAFGIEKIYPTKEGGNEWYVNMDNPTSDPNLRNIGNIDFSRNSDGSWKVSADQIRMEAWSPENEKWRDIEITEYAKIESGSNELLQMYSRGGHHTSRDECLGSAYKARLYGDGRAAWTKEVTHPAYAGNRGEVHATSQSLEDRWIGHKAVIYNFEENGNTYVRLESYIDDDVTDSNGNLVIGNNWKLTSVVEDRGGWATDNSDFNSSCGKDRDEILTQPGGTATQNIAAWRSDELTWSFKYLSVREIDPSRGETPSDESSQAPVENDDADSLCTTEYCKIITSNHSENRDKIGAISSIELTIKKSTTQDSGTIVVAIVEGNEVLAKTTMSASEIDTRYTVKTIQFAKPAIVEDAFDIVVAYEGTGLITVSSLNVN